ncbi:MAG: HAMP domain-containing histidine kinase [Pyrinomonadaceae bacterium]|nr:HAMP domain-containing histidine kinase [Pyrinomonadaceae bacterium]
MSFIKKNSLVVSIALAIIAAAVVTAFWVKGGSVLAFLGDGTSFDGNAFEIWKLPVLFILAAFFGLAAEKLSAARYLMISAGFLVFWFAAGMLFTKVTGMSFLFLPVAFLMPLVFAAVHTKKLWIIDDRLNQKLQRLAQTGQLLEGKSADFRIESGLTLLKTVLPLSEVIVFKRRDSGELMPIGRTRNESGTDSLSSRQNSWRNNVEMCERALDSGETVLQIEDETKGAAKIALPLVVDDLKVGGLFINVREDFEQEDQNLLEAFSDQLARNFQRKDLRDNSIRDGSKAGLFSTANNLNREGIVNLVKGTIEEQSFGVVATSYFREAHAIAYLDGTIAHANRQMLGLAKVTEQEIAGINLFDLLERFKTDLFNEPKIAIRRVLQTGKAYECELEFPEVETKLGLEINLVKNSTEIGDSEIIEKPACLLITFRDITAIKENEKMRSDMTNLMSHELRTPITSIQGFAEMLMLDENIPEESREYLQTIANESQRAANLLSNFLSVANLQQSDKKEFLKSPVKLDKVVEEVVGNLQDEAKRKRIRLVERQDKRIPVVAADRGLITKAISHLIDNAIKYSPERSSVIISTILESDFLRVEVEDRGYGIPAAEQEKIWQKFYRVARTGQDKEEESTGLGLSIVKEIIEQHSGDVSVKSEDGFGSKFSFRIPRF